MWLFVEDHEQVCRQPKHQRPLQHTHTTEEQRLADDDREDGDIHRVADKAVPAGDDEVLRWRDRRWSAEASQRESREGVEKSRESGDDEHDPDPPERREAEQRRG